MEERVSDITQGVSSVQTERWSPCNSWRRCAWPLGVIEELMPGRDGAVRAVQIRIRGGITTRPITVVPHGDKLSRIIIIAQL